MSTIAVAKRLKGDLDAGTLDGLSSEQLTSVDDATTSTVKTWSSSKIDSTKQDTLVSATNIKTINGASILGSGDLTIAGGVSPDSIEVLTSGTAWTNTGNHTKAIVYIEGGSGGGGAGNNYVVAASGGGGGGCKVLLSLTAGATYSYIIGAGGAGATTADFSGASGGYSQFTAGGVNYRGGGGGGGWGGGIGAGGSGGYGSGAGGVFFYGNAGEGAQSQGTAGGTSAFGGGRGGESYMSSGGGGAAGRIILELYK